MVRLYSKMYLYSKIFKSHNYNNHQLPTTNITTTYTAAKHDADLQEIREISMQQERRTALGRNGHII